MGVAGPYKPLLEKEPALSSLWLLASGCCSIVGKPCLGPCYCFLTSRMAGNKLVFNREAKAGRFLLTDNKFRPWGKVGGGMSIFSHHMHSMEWLGGVVIPRKGDGHKSLSDPSCDLEQVTSSGYAHTKY